MKHFTKLIGLLLSFVLVFSMVGCGGAEDKNTEEKKVEITSIDQLLNEDYMYSTSGPAEDSNVWTGVYLKAEDYSAAYRVVINFTEDELAAYNALDFVEEDAEQKMLDILKGAKDCTITDITDQIPTQDELDKEFVGKTIGELEETGFENSGQTNDEQGHVQFFYDGPEYNVLVVPKEEIEDIDDYSPNDIRALEIGTAKFWGFSDSILEQ